MHRADVFPRTIENTPFWSDGCMLFLQFAPFCVSFSEQLHHGTFGSYICLAHFTYICLANHSAVSKPHPTEGAEICTRCGIFRCYKARRSVLVVVHAACAVCCSFVVLTFLFPTATYVIFFEYQTRTSTSTVCTAYDTCVACLRKIQGARDSRYSTRLLPSSHSGVDASAEHAALRGLPLRSVVSDQNAVTIATTTRPLLFFAATSSRSVISPDRNNALAVAYSESSYVG